MEITLENGFNVYILESGDQDKELDFSMTDNSEKGNSYGFQTILTKKDARAIMRTLDGWLSNQGIK